VAELRPRQAGHHHGGGQDRQQPDPAARAAARLAGDLPGQTDVGVFDGRRRAAPSAPEQGERLERQQPQPFRL
jgi:hypothetical protein